PLAPLTGREPLTELQLSHATAEAWERVAGPALGRLRGLTLFNSRTGGPCWLAPLAGRPNPSGPGHPQVPLMPPGGGHLREFVAAPLFARLKRLSWAARGSAAVRALAASAAAAGLEEVALFCAEGSNEAARHLAGSPHLTGLRALDLNNDLLENDAARALA